MANVSMGGRSDHGQNFPSRNTRTEWGNIFCAGNRREIDKLEFLEEIKKRLDNPKVLSLVELIVREILKLDIIKSKIIRNKIKIILYRIIANN